MGEGYIVILGGDCMKSFVQLTLEEYEELKKLADDKNIKVEQSVRIIPSDGKALEANVTINMRELKLQICRQQNIDPEITTVNFIQGILSKV